MTRHAIAVFFVTLGLLTAFASRQALGETPPALKNRSGVVIRQTEIIGQVHIASERPGRRDEPAVNVPVQVRVPENDVLIHQTQTDRNGSYTIPVLKVGAYHMFIGALRINLLVEEKPAEDELPKIIITILPKEMLRRTR